MEAQIAIFAFIVFVVVSAVLILVSLFGTKEKTYEDALAEQRQQTNVLLGAQTRPKAKDKKQKKTSKKVKEKHVVASNAEITEESENNETTLTETNFNNPKVNLHVEFQKPTIIEVLSEEIQIPNFADTQKHVKKVRPILLQKDPKENRPVIPNIEVPPANHFEKIHPKDEFELVRSRSNSQTRDEYSNKSQKSKISVSEPDTVKGNKSTSEQLEKLNKNKENQISVQDDPKEKTKEKQADNTKGGKKIKQKETSILQSEKDKDAEKKKEDFLSCTMAEVLQKQTSVQQILNVPSTKEKKKRKAGANGDVNVQLLIDAVRTAELSRSEVQILIDLLLNKQHEASPDSEWSEGKADPVQKLKKQLAEKEKLLSEEQEALSSAQARLREIRAEQQAEKSQLLQKLKGLEDALQGKNLELQTADQRLHNQNQKIQQLQGQLNEEAMAIHKLREEQATWVVQRQQLEMRLSQTQDVEATIVQLRNELQDLQNRNNQLSIELHSLNDQSIATKEHQQNLIVQLQHQLTCFKNEVDQKDEYIRQLEESGRDLEHRFNVAHRQENELKVEISQLKSTVQQNIEEIRRLELGKNQSIEQLKKLEKQREEWERKEDELEKALLNARSQLEIAEQDRKDIQNSQQSLMLNEIKDYQEQIKNLENDLKTISVTFQEHERVHKEDVTNYNNQLNVLQRELNNFKSKDERLESELGEYKTLNTDLSKKLGELKQQTVKLSQELQEQKDKNNEIRKKNWKVVEALNAAENKIKSFLNSSKQNPSEKEFSKKVVEQREVRQQTEEFSQKSDNSEEVDKLQVQIVNYKSIIDNTEGILRNLESHIQKEELSWRKQLSAKELEIEGLKQKHLDELRSTVSELELQVLNERRAKENLIRDCQKLESKKNAADSSVIVEKLSEEISRLTEQLEAEKKKNCEGLTKTSEEPQQMLTEISNGCEKVHNGATNVNSLLTQNVVLSTPTSAVSVKHRNKRHRKKKASSETEAQ
ncbi:ribosome-binding protein 1 isoform X3 [Agrilus planipennis]|uniref:Ribosome-binding protein 1 isoform X3 n=2 Tax=Agrilus planipennis TaxID=224129 RepID=A0A7F5QXR0_AGRPL|nr:ribosome-binding protein 1 isoform X3 [Agrilus planipennis]